MPTKAKKSKNSGTGKKAAKATRRTAAKPAPRSGATLKRADLGAPIDAFFEKQPPSLRPILDTLRLLVAQAAPDATSSLKWGMPFFSVGGHMLCAFGGHKSHVNLILPRTSRHICRS
jgi:Domain of unknown function (DU1801)